MVKDEMTTLKQIWDNYQVPLMERKTAQRVFKEWLQQKRKDDTINPYQHRDDTFAELLEELEQ